MSEEYKIERTSRDVIEHKLLTALQDKDKVAAIFSKQDLEDLILAFSLARVHSSSIQGTPAYDRIKDLQEGLHKLLKEAFPQ